MFANLFIHPRLGCRGFVGLVMATAAVAHQIDDHVLLEFVAVIHGQLRDEKDRFRVIAVHVQDGRLDHLGHICAVLGRACIVLMTGGETDLVVDDDMDGPADSKARVWDI